MTNIEHYADAILSMVQRGETPHQAVKALGTYLEARGQKSVLARLRPALERKEAAAQRRLSAVLEVARQKDAPRAKKEASVLFGTLFSSPTATVVREDEGLIGGWRLISGSNLVDNSHKKHLLNFYKDVTR